MSLVLYQVQFLSPINFEKQLTDMVFGDNLVLEAIEDEEGEGDTNVFF